MSIAVGRGKNDEKNSENEATTGPLTTSNNINDDKNNDNIDGNSIRNADNSADNDGERNADGYGDKGNKREDMVKINVINNMDDYNKMLQQKNEITEASSVKNILLDDKDNIPQSPLETDPRSALELNALNQTIESKNLNQKITGDSKAKRNQSAGEEKLVENRESLPLFSTPIGAPFDDVAIPLAATLSSSPSSPSSPSSLSSPPSSSLPTPSPPTPPLPTPALPPAPAPPLSVAASISIAESLRETLYTEETQGIARTLTSTVSDIINPQTVGGKNIVMGSGPVSLGVLGPNLGVSGVLGANSGGVGSSLGSEGKVDIKREKEILNEKLNNILTTINNKNEVKSNMKNNQINNNNNDNKKDTDNRQTIDGYSPATAGSTAKRAW